MNALSIPTWMVHVSSIIEWIVAIWLVWRYGELTGEKKWWGLAVAMFPALIGAMCAVTWHFFDNAEALKWLVVVQASMTLLGNLALCVAAWWIWKTAESSPSS